MRSSGPSRTSSAAARTESGIGLASGSVTWSIETGSRPSPESMTSSSRTAVTAVAGNSTRRSGSPQPHHFIPGDRALALRPGRNRLEAVECLVQGAADGASHHRRSEPRQASEPPVEGHRHLSVSVLGLEVDLGARPAHETLEGRPLDGLLEDVALAVALLDAAKIRPDTTAPARPEHLRPAALSRLIVADVLDPLGVGPPARQVVGVGDHGPECARRRGDAAPAHDACH